MLTDLVRAALVVYGVILVGTLAFGQSSSWYMSGTATRVQDRWGWIGMILFPAVLGTLGLVVILSVPILTSVVVWAVWELTTPPASLGLSAVVVFLSPGFVLWGGLRGISNKEGP